MTQNKNEIIYLTLHAKERMALRLGVKPHKMQRVALKAWRCKHWDRWEYQKREYQRQFRPDGQLIHYRQMLGKIWVFEQIPTQIKLITILN